MVIQRYMEILGCLGSWMAIKGSPFGEFFQEGIYSTVGSMLEP